MPNLVENSTGVNFTDVHKASSVTFGPKFAVGTRIRANDRDYVYARATGAVANNAAVILTEPAMTVASGAGAWTNKTGVALVLDDHAWFQRNTI
jgi:hypothetical protein